MVKITAKTENRPLSSLSSPVFTSPVFPCLPQGEWYCSGETEEESKDELRSSGDYYEVDGLFYAKENYSSYQELLTAIQNAKSSWRVAGCVLGPFGKESETIEIYGIDKLVITEDGIIKYKKQGETEKDIVLVDDTHIKINGYEYEKQ